MAHPSFSSSRFFFLLSLVSLAVLACSESSAQQTPQQTPSTATSPTPAQYMIAEIQVVPRPAGTASDHYKYVDAAIAVIQASGLHYEVNGMGTVVEGPPEQVWPLLQAVHQATLESGAERTLTIIKVSSSAQAGGPRVADLLHKFRN